MTSDEVEQEKLAIEREKLAVELSKVRWTALSIGVPIMAAVITAAFGFWSNYQTGHLQFKLKAAELIMQPQDPDAGLGRARFLKAAFGSDLDSISLPENTAGFGEASPQIRIDLFKVFAEKTNNGSDILSIWRALFPDDEWARSEALPQAVTAIRQPPPSKPGQSN
jgi:hypothetical protein